MTSGPLLLSIRAAASAGGLGRDFTYQLVRDGQLGSVKVGGKRLVPLAELERWVTEHTDRDAAEADRDG